MEYFEILRLLRNQYFYGFRIPVNFRYVFLFPIQHNAVLGSCNPAICEIVNKYIVRVLLDSSLMPLAGKVSSLDSNFNRTNA